MRDQVRLWTQWLRDAQDEYDRFLEDGGDPIAHSIFEARCVAYDLFMSSYEHDR